MSAESASLEAVAKIVNGGTPRSDVAEYWGGDVQWLTPKDMGQMRGREIASTPRTLTQAGLQNSSARQVPENSIILSTRAPIGHLAINKQPMAFNQGCRGIVPGDHLDHQFLYYFLLANRSELDELGTGATFKELSTSALRSFEIPLPPLDEQRRIVAKLDQDFAALDRARINAEASLRDTQDLHALSREQILEPSQPGWSEQMLSDLIDVKHGYAFKSESFASEGEHVLLTPGNFHEGGGFRDRGVKQKFHSGDVPEQFILNEGSLLMAMTEQASGLLGSCILVPEGGRYLHNQRLGLILPKRPDEWFAPYFAHVFNLSAFRRALSDTCTGLKVRHTSPARIQSVAVPVPPTLADQRAVAERLERLSESVRRLQDAGREKLADIATLRQSLLQAAFSGQLS